MKNQSMTGKHIFLFSFGTAFGAAVMHFWMKHEGTEAATAPKTSQTAVAGLQYVPEQIKRY